MCLERPLAFDNVPEEGKGYKVFILDDRGRLLGDSYTEYKVRVKNRWLHEADFRSITRGEICYIHYAEDGKTYPAGFHIWLRASDAWAWAAGVNSMRKPVVYKVLYRGKTAAGWQIGTVANGRCVVAREMKILSRETRRSR